ncbi:MAG: exonuclease SbcCD subunit D C-terminal domain-containing protein [Halioglobus sp.]|nr:exonuclease SbcCD subunit D C-terminal domain-containing protein [Halioglobus sp.]
MKLLHTSDWHIGRTLYGRNRYEEFEAFLGWLAGQIRERDISVLVVAGDIFDTSVPSNRAQALYYRFLCEVAASDCRHVVVVAGNHDSPSFLNAPRELLKALDVHVIGNACTALEDEVLLLRDDRGEPELIVCAVPYLRDRDIRLAEAGESTADKESKLLQGIHRHYAAVGELAEQLRAELGEDIPIVGTGHLFTAGGQTVEGDGVRELYVGSLAHVNAAIFPSAFDYVALGHLHVPQTVGGNEHIRYSGSPVPMGFGEAKQQKSVCEVEFSARAPAVTRVEVPVFQRLERIAGDWSAIERRIQALAADGTEGWLEVVYEGAEIIGDLRDRLEEAIEGSALEVLRIKNTRIANRVLEQIDDDETLDDLDIYDVFERCLGQHGVPDEQRLELLQTYREVITSLQERDVRAE